MRDFRCLNFAQRLVLPLQGVSRVVRHLMHKVSLHSDVLWHQQLCRGALSQGAMLRRLVVFGLVMEATWTQNRCFFGEHEKAYLQYV